MRNAVAGDGANGDLVASLNHMDKDNELGTMHPTVHSVAAQTARVTATGKLVHPAGKAPVGLNMGMLLKCFHIMLSMCKAANND